MAHLFDGEPGRSDGRIYRAGALRLRRVGREYVMVVACILGTSFRPTICIAGQYSKRNRGGSIRKVTVEEMLDSGQLPVEPEL